MRRTLAGSLRPWGLLLGLLAAACTNTPAFIATSPPPSATAVFPATAVSADTAVPRASATVSSPPTKGVESLITPTASVFEPTSDATALIATVTAHGTPQVLAALASPDGQWSVEALRSDCAPMGGDSLAYERLVLHDTVTGEARGLADQLLNCGGLGAFGLEPLYWSSDSRYIYYTTARAGSPDGGGCNPWHRPIVRADIQTDEKVDLAEGVTSPDGKLSAGYFGQEVVVWGQDMSEVVRAMTAEPAGGFGPLAWAPDGKAVVYLRWDAGCPQFGGKSVLIRLDLPSGDQTVLFHETIPIFMDVNWDSAAELILTDTDGQGWRYDLATHTLTQIL